MTHPHKARYAVWPSAPRGTLPAARSATESVARLSEIAANQAGAQTQPNASPPPDAGAAPASLGRQAMSRPGRMAHSASTRPRKSACSAASLAPSTSICAAWLQLRNLHTCALLSSLLGRLVGAQHQHLCGMLPRRKSHSQMHCHVRGPQVWRIAPACETPASLAPSLHPASAPAGGGLPPTVHVPIPQKACECARHVAVPGVATLPRNADAAAHGTWYKPGQQALAKHFPVFCCLGQAVCD